MEDKEWYKQHSEKLNKLRVAGDTKGERRLYFGSYVRHMRRIIPKLSQSKAAELAGMSRSQWARIEAGKHIPRPHKIADMADAIRVQVEALYRKAGYEVPDKYAVYDLRAAGKDFTIAIREASDFQEFIARMQEVWQLFRQEDKGKRKGFIVDREQAGLIAAIYEKMNAPQRIRLAYSLVRSVSVKAVRATLRDADAFLKDLDSKDDLAKDYKGLL